MKIIPQERQPDSTKTRPLLRDDTKFAQNKIAAFQYLTVAVFVYLITGYWDLQVLKEEIFKAKAQQNQIKSLPIPAPRGRILDRDGRVLLERQLQDRITALAWGGPQGDWLAIAQADGLVRVASWKPSEKALDWQADITGHDGAVYALAFSPNGRTLASGGYDRVVVLSDPQTGQERARLTGHVERIRTLTRQGFYNGTVFHRVIDGFMAQTGDPKGDGTGGSKYGNLPAEFTNTPFERGVIGAARTSDPNSANSQFFLVFQRAPHLNGQYTVWGRVVDGMTHVDQIKKGEPGSGRVADPDRILKAYLLADAKN